MSKGPGAAGDPAQGTDPRHRHQPEDARVDRAAVIVAILLVSVLAVYLGIGGLGHLYARFPLETRAAETDLAVPGAPPPSPAAGDTLRLLRERLTGRQRALLEETGWVDRDNGIARIPLERAMAIAVRRGLPGFQKGETR